MEVPKRQSVVVGPRVSRHNTTVESSLVKRSEEEVWSQKAGRQVGRQEGWRCKKNVVQLWVAPQLWQRLSKMRLLQRRDESAWSTGMTLSRNGVELEGRKEGR